MKSILAKAFASLAFGLIGMNVVGSVAWSQSTTMKFVLSVPPGGPTDLLARVMADQIGKEHGVSTIVENRPGGDNVVAAQAVAHSLPDGNTIFINAPAFLITPQLYNPAPYDPFQFEPICNLVNSPVVLAVNAAAPYHSLADLVTAARAKPGELTFASVGPGSPIRLGVEMLKRAASADMIYVPFKGDGPAVTALLGGHVTAMLGNFASMSGHISAGELRALAVGARTRIPSLPDVPTVAESGYPDYEVSVWFGAVAREATPKTKIAQLGEWFTEALNTSEAATKLAGAQLQPALSCGADYSKFLHAQYDAFGRIIRDANITIQ